MLLTDSLTIVAKQFLFAPATVRPRFDCHHENCKAQQLNRSRGWRVFVLAKIASILVTISLMPSLSALV
jgi:hypothetical protein